MTISIDIVEGRIIVYGSFTIRNPTTLTADFFIQSGGSSGINYFVSPDLYERSTSRSSGGLGRRKRQAEKNVYLAIVGLMSNNSFTMNTTTGDTVPYVSPSPSLFMMMSSSTIVSSSIADVVGSSTSDTRATSPILIMSTTTATTATPTSTVTPNSGK